jgi:PEP-CTERM motif
LFVALRFGGYFMNKMFALAALAALSCAVPATAQSIGGGSVGGSIGGIGDPNQSVSNTTTTYNSAPVGGFNYGSGNDYTPTNAVDVRTTTLDPLLGDVVTGDLAARFHVTGQPAPSAPAGIYLFDVGQNISFDYSLFGNVTGANLMLTNLLTGDTAHFDPTSALLGNTLTMAGAIQNSEQLGFGFLNGSFPALFGDLNFDASIDNTYRLDLTAGGHTATAYAQVGTGAVPEPATWAMMLLGFCAVGLSMRRQRKTVLAQAA